MGLKSLKQLRQEQADKEAQQAEWEANKLVWFKAKDGKSVFVRVAQEFDEDSKNYSKKNGLAVIATEHTDPQNFRVKALCSGDEGEPCLGCERHAYLNKTDSNYKGGWKQKPKMYVNVIVKGDVDDKGKEIDPYVAVLQSSTNPKSVIGSTILQYDAEYGTVTDRWFKIGRKGSGANDTVYSILAKDPDNDINVEDFEMQDLTKATREVAYEDQAAFYKFNASAEVEEEDDSPSTDDDSVW